MEYAFCGQGELRALLTRLVASPAVAYGFFGPAHVGKRLLAEWFARQLLDFPAPNPLEGHPDVALLDAHQDASIEAVRAFLERAHRTAARGGRRIFLIDHAEGLNPAGYNALLKDVEEPRSGVTFLFIAAQPDALPATLRSRLVPLTVREVAAAELRSWAQQELKVPAAWADEAHGRPGLLVRRLQQPEWWDELQRHARRIREGYVHEEPGALIAVLDEWQKTVDAQDDADQSWRLLILCLARQWSIVDGSAEFGFAQAVRLAWRVIGGPLPARLAFEWSRLETPEHAQKRLQVIHEWSR